MDGLDKRTPLLMSCVGSYRIHDRGSAIPLPDPCIPCTTVRQLQQIRPASTEQIYYEFTSPSYYSLVFSLLYGAFIISEVKLNRIFTIGGEKYTLLIIPCPPVFNLAVKNHKF